MELQMKNKFKLIGICLLLTLSLSANECKIISSPAMKDSDVIGTDAIALSISHIYYDKNKKMQLKSYSDAFLEFNKKAIDYIQKDCKKYKIKNIYNFQIHSIIDKNYYHFNATYDFSNVN